MVFAQPVAPGINVQRIRPGASDDKLAVAVAQSGEVGVPGGIVQVLHARVEEDPKGKIDGAAGHDQQGDQTSREESRGQQSEAQQFQRYQREVRHAEVIALAHHGEADQQGKPDEHQPEIPFPGQPLAAAKRGHHEPNHQRPAKQSHGENQVGLVEQENIVAHHRGRVRLVEEMHLSRIVRDSGHDGIEDVAGDFGEVAALNLHLGGD